MKLARLILSFGLLLGCAAAEKAPEIHAGQAGAGIVVIWIPLGVAPICALGYQNPGCIFAASGTQYWMKIVEVDGIVVSVVITAVGPGEA